MTMRSFETVAARLDVALWGRRYIVATVVAALMTTTLETGGVVRGLVVASTMLVAPGLSVTLWMGPMPLETRALISVCWSVALLTMLATAMALSDSWSPVAGLWIIAGITAVITVIPFLRRAVARPISTLAEDVERR